MERALSTDLERVAASMSNGGTKFINVQLLSNGAEAALSAANPTLSPGRIDGLLQLVAVVMLRTSRRAFLAAAISDVRGLRDDLELKVRDLGRSGEI